MRVPPVPRRFTWDGSTGPSRKRETGGKTPKTPPRLPGAHTWAHNNRRIPGGEPERILGDPKILPTHPENPLGAVGG